MKWIPRVLWVLVLWGISFLVFVLALDLIPQETLETFTRDLYESLRLRLGVGAVATFFLLAGIVFLQWILRQHQRERTIAFHNPDGDVTVSLEAIEDFVKRLGSEQEGVEELRVSISAEREGISLQLHAGLWSTCQIPETTQHLQNLIQAHLHEMLGVEGPVTVHVHVGKVLRPPKQAAVLEASQKTFAEKLPPS